ncbi:MAG: Rrf2 family transcriptional regulator [Phycisphaeraceae bacterium]|nr:Rrf2 family transcriptional regulator [Phycisphaeraceae bacterium]
MISQTIEYALRAMIYLSSLAPGVASNSESIAARTKVPHGYLSKVLRDLVVAELVSSQRGPNGGFSLAKPASEISMLDIVNAVDGIQRIKRCPLGNPAHIDLCPLHRRLDNALAAIEQDFAQTTLAEVLETNSKSGRQCQSLVAPTVKGKKA